MRMFPIPHQAGAVMLLLVLYHFMIFWTDGLDRPRLHRLEPLAARAVGRAAVAADRRGRRHADPPLALIRRAATMARSVRLKDHWAEQRMFGRRVIAARGDPDAASARCSRASSTCRSSGTTTSATCRRATGSASSRAAQPRADLRPQRRAARAQPPGVPARGDPRATPDLADTLKRLVGIGLMPAEDYERTLRTIKARRRFECVPIRLQLSEEELARFAVNRPDFPGVEVRPRLTRYYPHGGHRRACARLRRRDQRAGPGAHRHARTMPAPR